MEQDKTIKRYKRAMNDFSGILVCIAVFELVALSVSMFAPDNEDLVTFVGIGRITLVVASLFQAHIYRTLKK